MRISENVQTMLSSASKNIVGAESDSPVNFSNMLKDAVYKVNETQVQSQQATMKLATGEIEDISQVTIAAEKAAINLQLAIQVRNKVLDAYQEIMRMQM